MCAGLVERWRSAAASAGWVSPHDWWHPAVEAVAAAVALGGDPVPAVHRLGRARADVGASVGEALADLATLYGVAAGGLPPYDVTRALAESHAEGVLDRLFGRQCEDPLTCLTSMDYLCSRLAEEYRAAELHGTAVGDRKALVVVEHRATGGPPTDRLAGAVRRIDVGVAVRTVFAGGETCTQAGDDRVVVLVDRVARLPFAVGLLRELLVDGTAGGATARTWVEPLGQTYERSVAQLRRLAGERGRLLGSSSLG